MRNWIPYPAALLALLAVTCATAWSQDRRVVAYVSMDEEHSRGILELFTERTGIETALVFDTEDHKTVGLTGRIIAARASPRCDVFWNNEVGQTVRLKNLGLLEPYVSTNAKGIPDGFKDAEGYWTGFAARARVLIYNTDLIEQKDLPKRLEDLVDPRFRGMCAMSRPLTGTSLTHAGALYAHWGADRTEAFYRQLTENGVRWERGNAQVMRSVSKGTRRFGVTDTDDARVAVLGGARTATIYLDEGEDGMGTLVIPNTVMIVKGGPNPKEARKLVDFLLSDEVETMLAEGRSVQIPLHAGVPTPPHVDPLGRIKSMKVEYAAVGRMIERHAADLEALFDEEDSGFSLLWAGGALALILLLVTWFMRGSRSAT